MVGLQEVTVLFLGFGQIANALTDNGTRATWTCSRLFVHSDWCRPVKTEADFTDESPTVDQFLRDSSELSSAIEERF